MIKIKNKVVTRKQLEEIKKLHNDSYNEYLERKRNLYNKEDRRGFINSVVFATEAMQLVRPKTIKQCVREVLTKKEGDNNGI